MEFCEKTCKTTTRPWNFASPPWLPVLSPFRQNRSGCDRLKLCQNETKCFTVKVECVNRCLGVGDIPHIVSPALWKITIILKSHFTSDSKLCWRGNPATCALHTAAWFISTSLSIMLIFGDGNSNTTKKTPSSDFFHRPTVVFLLPPDQLLAKLTVWTPTSPQQGLPPREPSCTATLFQSKSGRQCQWNLHT